MSAFASSADRERQLLIWHDRDNTAEELLSSPILPVGTILLLQESNKHNRVHVIGTAGLCKELQSVGFDVSGGPDPIDTPSGMSPDELAVCAFSEGDIDVLPRFYRSGILRLFMHLIWLVMIRDITRGMALVRSVKAYSGRTATNNVGNPSP
ncbi:hypothetical protein ACHAXN_006602 [Cyclotella atomus]